MKWKNIKFTATGLVSVILGGLSIFSGGTVALGLRDVDYTVLPVLLLYNIIAGIAAVIAGAGLFLLRRWAVKLTGVIAGAHLLVLAVISERSLAGMPIAAESIWAMVFRTAVWAVMVWLLTRR